MLVVIYNISKIACLHFLRFLLLIVCTKTWSYYDMHVCDDCVIMHSCVMFFFACTLPSH